MKAKAVVGAFNQEKALVGAFSLLRDCENRLWNRWSTAQLCDSTNHSYCSPPRVARTLSSFQDKSSNWTLRRHVLYWAGAAAAVTMQFTKSVVCSIVTTNGTLGKLVLTSVLRLTTTQHRLASDSNKRIYLIWGIAQYEHNIAFPKSAKLAEKGHIRQVYIRAGPQGTLSGTHARWSAEWKAASQEARWRWYRCIQS